MIQLFAFKPLPGHCTVLLFDLFTFAAGHLTWTAFYLFTLAAGLMGRDKKISFFYL